ncbi:TPA: hypothetical protein LU109_003603 [Enterobacter hormaechei subsp. xiangfangensis]|nr:hypothetical protein [Enterobacter hormaechei subsp. xiangfangensis]
MSINYPVLIQGLMTAANLVLAIRSKNQFTSKLNWCLSGFGISNMLVGAISGFHVLS